MPTFVDVPEIKLIRTDTTLDLSQKAEKVCSEHVLHRYLYCDTPNNRFMGGKKTWIFFILRDWAIEKKGKKKRVQNKKENSSKKKKLRCVEGPLKHDRGRLLTKPLEAKSGSRGQALKIVRQAKLPGAKPQGQTWKNRHGVETYKFFQNWLRVPFLCLGVPYVLCRGDKSFMGAKFRRKFFRAKFLRANQDRKREKKTGTCWADAGFSTVGQLAEV